MFMMRPVQHLSIPWCSSECFIPNVNTYSKIHLTRQEWSQASDYTSMQWKWQKAGRKVAYAKTGLICRVCHCASWWKKVVISSGALFSCLLLLALFKFHCSVPANTWWNQRNVPSLWRVTAVQAVIAKFAIGLGAKNISLVSQFVHSACNEISVAVPDSLAWEVCTLLRLLCSLWGLMRNV